MKAAPQPAAKLHGRGARVKAARGNGRDRPSCGLLPDEFRNCRRGRKTGRIHELAECRGVKGGVFRAAVQLSAMDAGGYEKAVKALVMCALDIRAHSVPNGKNSGAISRRLAYPACQFERPCIDRGKRLASLNDLAARCSVTLGDRTSAIKQLAAVFDDDIGIGANELKAPRLHGLEDSVIILGRLAEGIGEAGAKDKFCFFQRHEARRLASLR